MMPDQQLLQYAQMHKNDPYIFPMAFQESNTRKQMRAAQAPQAGQAPKVVDQDLQDMAQTMPENQGIGTLPAPNMQNMAGGGIVAFGPGGSTGADDAFDKAFKKVLQLEGGAKYIKDDAGKGPTKYGINQTANPDVDIKNLTEDQAKEIYRKRYWDKIGGDDIASSNPKLATIAFDAAVNQGVKPALRMLDQSEGDPNALLALRQKRYIQLAKNNDNLKQYLPGWTSRVSSLQKDLAPPTEQTSANSRIAKTLTNLMPFGSANAGEVLTNPAIDQIPGQTKQAPPTKNTGITALTSEDVINQIPGQTGQAPAAKDESTFFGNLADKLGIPPEYQRNINNALMAPTPLAPITTLPKAAKSSGLAALGEKLYNKVIPAAGMTEKEIAALRAETEAARLAQTAQLPPRLTPPAQVLEQGSQVIPVAQTGEATVQSAANLEKARLANQATDQLAASQAAARTAQETAKLPSMAERLQQASYLRESDEAARLMARARAATNVKTSLQTGEGLASIAPTDALYADNTTANKYDSGVMGGAPLPTAEDDIVAALKNKPEAVAAAPEEKTGGMDMNRLMLQMGLHLMAGKSPNAMTNVGEAGLGVLGMQQAEAKAKTEDEYRKAMGLEAGSKAKYFDAFTAATERGAKEKNLQLEAEKLIAQEISKDKFINMPGQEAARAAREREMRATIYRNLGIAPTMAAGAPTGGAKFIGFENPA
jgi:hypothetical protein